LQPSPSAPLPPYTTLFRSVCTGTRACQLSTMSFPPRLNAQPLSTEGYVRAYHRVDVTALPSPTESCSPILGIDFAGGVPICSARSEEHTSELQSRVDLVCR